MPAGPDPFAPRTRGCAATKIHSQAETHSTGLFKTVGFSLGLQSEYELEMGQHTRPDLEEAGMNSLWVAVPAGFRAGLWNVRIALEEYTGSPLHSR